MFCKKCGAEMNDDALFCSACGARNVEKMFEGSVAGSKKTDEKPAEKESVSEPKVYPAYMESVKEMETIAQTDTENIPAPAPEPEAEVPSSDDSFAGMLGFAIAGFVLSMYGGIICSILGLLFCNKVIKAGGTNGLLKAGKIIGLVQLILGIIRTVLLIIYCAIWLAALANGYQI